MLIADAYEPGSVITSKHEVRAGRNRFPHALVVELSDGPWSVTRELVDLGSRDGIRVRVAPAR
jgi:hypothetical protein